MFECYHDRMTSNYSKCAPWPSICEECGGTGSAGNFNDVAPEISRRSAPVGTGMTTKVTVNDGWPGQGKFNAIKDVAA